MTKQGYTMRNRIQDRKHGCLCVSLDFEMYWGLQDAVTLEQYGENLLGGKAAIARQLELFSEYGIHATWGAVGMLFAKDVKELETYLPDLRPSYELARRDPYRRIAELNANPELEPYYFAANEIALIAASPNQELASHSFSHYYCTERGQTPQQFAADMEAAVKIASHKAYAPVSLLLPRNQCSGEYLQLCAALGVTAYRGTEDNCIYRNIHKERWLRLFRFADSYLPLSGANAHLPQRESGMVNIKGSAFLRPYEPRLALLEPIKLSRIKGQLRYAAKHGLVYHLYWHPHNLGANTEKNFAMQRKLFEYCKKLQSRYGLKFCNMREIAEELAL